MPENARKEIPHMEDETSAPGSRGKKPAQRKTRKSEEAAPGGENSSRELADDDERADPGQSVSEPAAPEPEPAAPEPDAEGLERLRNRLMAKRHGRRR
jgi:hypothetical protein